MLPLMLVRHILAVIWAIITERAVISVRRQSAGNGGHSYDEAWQSARRTVANDDAIIMTSMAVTPPAGG